MGGSPTYEYRDGQRLAPAVAADLDRMSSAMLAEEGTSLHVSDGGGLRTVPEQQAKRDAYLWYLRGGPWAPLAADPTDPLAHHVESNPNGARAVDLHDSGSDPGILTAGTRRQRWIAANCGRFNFRPEGYGFSPVEMWHFLWTGSNPWATTGAPTSTPSTSTGVTPTTRGDDLVKILHNQKGGGIYVVGPQMIKHLGNMKDVDQAEKTFGPMISLDDNAFRIALLGFHVPYGKAVKGADWAA